LNVLSAIRVGRAEFTTRSDHAKCFRKDDLRVVPNVMAVTKRIPPLEMRRNVANSALNQVPHIPQMSLGRQNVPQTDAHNSATV
jgi:hypothetical protein